MSERYSDFQLQPIAGEWRKGSGERTARVTNPYDGSELLEIQLATRDDLDAAFLAAEKAQAAWAATPPAERSARSEERRVGKERRSRRAADQAAENQGVDKRERDRESNGD